MAQEKNTENRMKAKEKARAALQEALKVCTVTDLQHILADMQNEKMDEWLRLHQDYRMNQSADSHCNHERHFKALLTGTQKLIEMYKNGESPNDTY